MKNMNVFTHNANLNVGDDMVSKLYNCKVSFSNGLFKLIVTNATLHL